MSDENKDPNLQEWIDPELEARVVAWVLGEASEFEAAELERIVAEKPELAIFKRRIEAVHGLVRAATRGEGEAMKLNEDRRRKLLETIGEKESAAVQVVAMPQKETRTWPVWKVAAITAACLVLGALVSHIHIHPAINASKSAAMEQDVEMERSLATAGYLKPALAPATSALSPAAMPVEAAPSQPERLAALDELKQMGEQQKQQEGETLAQNEPVATTGGIGGAQASGGYKGYLGTQEVARQDEAVRGPMIADSVAEPPPPPTESAEPATADEPSQVQRKLLDDFSQSTAGAAAGNQSDSDMVAGGSMAVQMQRALGGEVLTHGVARSAQAAQDGQMLALNEGSITSPTEAPEMNTKAASATSTMVFGMNPMIPASQMEVSAKDQPFSTFSLHVSDVSFLLAKAMLAQGQLPDPESVRPEEFYNAFDYGDPAPATGEKIACHIEQAAHPLLQQRNLVRIAMKVAATGRGVGQALRLTVLLDTSGSMEREDRAASVQRAMQVLASLLGPDDSITLIGFARQPRLLAEAVPGDQAGKLVEIVKRTPPEGGTNMEEAIKLAGQLALRHFQAGAQNRVIMLTDGAANLGDADPDQLSKVVAELREKGLSFDACGVGASGLDDDMLEALTRKGGGRYYFLNQPEDADAGFASELAGAFRPAAENVKMQVRFNPDRVGNYRLIGFEKHRLNTEDFRNDKVTTAQLAAEEAAVALYQVQVLPEGEGEIGEVSVRFRDPASGQMVEESWTIPYDANAPALDKASPSMQLAGIASLLAEKLRGGAGAYNVNLDALAPIVGQIRGHYADQPRVQDLATMYEETRHMSGEQK
ncbi:MAG: von Willebrand factor type A domain-containing protein [Chthoniobacteraceae bacterium]|jgi:secreted protein with Ig-like and vWFA domain